MSYMGFDGYDDGYGGRVWTLEESADLVGGSRLDIRWRIEFDCEVSVLCDWNVQFCSKFTFLRVSLHWFLGSL